MARPPEWSCGSDSCHSRCRSGAGPGNPAAVKCPRSPPRLSRPRYGPCSWLIAAVRALLDPLVRLEADGSNPRCQCVLGYDVHLHDGSSHERVAEMGRQSRELAEQRFDVHAVNRVILEAIGLQAGVVRAVDTS
jgi:hypothetical protein